MPSTKQRPGEHDQGVDYDEDAFNDITNNFDRSPETDRNNPGRADYERKFTQRPSERNQGDNRDVNDTADNNTGDDLQDQETVAAQSQNRQPSASVGRQEEQGDSSWKTSVGAAKKKVATPVAPTTIQGMLVRFARSRGGVAGVILAITIIILTILVPFVGNLKVPGLMDIFNKFRGAATEIITDKVGRQVTLSSISTMFGKRKDGPVRFTDDSKFGRLMSDIGEDMQTRFNEAGFEFRQTGDGVNIRWNGRNLGTANSPNDIGRLFDNAPNDIRIQVQESFARAAPYRHWQKRLVANWVKAKWKIARFGVEENKDEDKSDEERRAETTRERVRTNSERTLSSFSQVVGCLLGFSSCEDEGRRPADENFDPEDDSGGSEEEGEERRRQAQEAVDREVSEAADEMADEAADDSRAGRSLSTNFTEKITQRIIGAAGSKAIPWIGWIDLLATLVVQIDKIARGDLIVNMAIRVKSEAAGYTYGTWSGYGDQIKDGEMSLDYAGVLGDQMGDASSSTAINYISGNGEQGVGLDESQKINSVRGDGGLPQSIQDAFDAAGASLLYTQPQTLAASYVWYYSVGWVLRKVSEPVGAAAVTAACASLKVQGWLQGAVTFGRFSMPNCDETVEMMTEASKAILPHLLPLLGLSSPLASGPELANMIDQGADVSYNQHGAEAGYRLLTPEEAATQHNRVLAYRQKEFDKLPLTEKIFSPNNSQSTLTQLAIMTPSFNMSMPGSSILNFISSMPSLAAGQLSKPLKASASTLSAGNVEFINLYGTKQYGATDADLAKIDEGIPNQLRTDEEECDPVEEDDTNWNNCVVYDNQFKTLEAAITGEDGTGGSAPDTTTETAGDPKALAKSILDSDKIDIVPKYKGQIEAIAKGNKSCFIDPRILDALLQLSKEVSFRISSLNRKCTNTITGSGTRSLHWQGKAADLDLINGAAPQWGRGQSGYKAKEALFKILPKFQYKDGLGAEIGQKGYGPSPPSGSKIIEVTDPPNHLHFGVDKSL